MQKEADGGRRELVRKTRLHAVKASQRLLRIRFVFDGVQIGSVNRVRTNARTSIS